MITAVVVIAISYLAIQKYQENRKNEKLLEMFIGTSDPDKMKEQMIKNSKELNKQINESNQKIINQISNIKPPTINLSNSYQDKIKEEVKRKKIAIQRKERELQRLQRESELAKRKLKSEMLIQ